LETFPKSTRSEINVFLIPGVFNDEQVVVTVNSDRAWLETRRGGTIRPQRSLEKRHDRGWAATKKAPRIPHYRVSKREPVFFCQHGYRAKMMANRLSPFDSGDGGFLRRDNVKHGKKGRSDQAVQAVRMKCSPKRDPLHRPRSIGHRFRPRIFPAGTVCDGHIWETKS